jgi:hypothetical protein
MIRAHQTMNTLTFWWDGVQEGAVHDAAAIRKDKVAGLQETLRLHCVCAKEQ